MNASTPASSDTATSTIVVGVDGTAANEGALRYASEEARSGGDTLRLVHVVPDLLPISPMMPLVPGDLADTGRTVLRQVEQDVQRLVPGVELEGELRHGARATELLRAAEGARALVLGRADHSLVRRVVEGDTATRAAARATVPVVEVPSQWRAAEHGVVLVGVKSPVHADELLGHAFAAAGRRAARLVVLHAWHLPSAYDDIIEGRVAQERMEQEGAREVEDLLSGWRSVYPDVEAEVRVVHDRPGHALVEASAAADLVVLVRRSHGVPAAAQLGGTARTLLRHAQCPVMVVPPTGSSDPLALEVEAEGRLLK